MKAKSKYTGYSPYPIDVILFSDIYLNLFVAGSYFLETDRRKGYLLLYEVNYTLNTMVSDSQEKLLIANSAGGLCIYELLGPCNPNLKCIWSKKIFDANTLILSVSISNIRKSAIVSTSMGDLCIFDLNSLEVIHKWKAHELECWTACYNIDSSFIFSGSDDCTFKIWDIRSAVQPIFTNTKSHEAGVISFISFDERLITGSFDDHIRLFDFRDFSKELWKENMSSPWRLIQHPENQFRILGCLMYEGAKVFDLNISENNEYKVRVYKEFVEHESIVYAGDWYNEQEVITCSFYDKKICLW
ncbi:hypothetical protein T552_01322 [Pneumocystis carinii B80]|uniref:methylated diphthine methylhydrolase n=1 Tax=Pneumocystis carinii (strain B80) TaxID=1408658 RepID=A0A0W4ZLV6_PNEC8|nr:hypothetical protein T552_01322 [Pneumocystis carinii B80]KTW29368.1 hypothetical protein T552_01322 [Pneumocystis carinii B80]